jgi:hypothetical protein
VRVTHGPSGLTARETTLARRREVAEAALTLAPIAIGVAWLLGIVGVAAGAYLVLLGLTSGAAVWVTGLLVILGSLALALLLSLAARIAEVVADRSD